MVLRVFVLIAALVQIGFPIFVNPFREAGGNAIGGPEPSQIEPAGYAFSIWGVIYLLALAYAVWQLTPAGRREPATARVAPAAVALYTGSSLWLWAADRGPLWATMPILVAMAACAMWGLAVFSRARPAGWRALVTTVPFALYAGWTCCAAFVNVAEVAPQYGFDRFGLPVPVWAALSLVAATGLAVAILWRTGSVAFAATVGWALVAILVAGRARGADDLVLATAGLALVTLALACLWRVRGRLGKARG